VLWSSARSIQGLVARRGIGDHAVARIVAAQFAEKSRTGMADRATDPGPVRELEGERPGFQNRPTSGAHRSHLDAACDVARVGDLAGNVEERNRPVRPVGGDLAGHSIALRAVAALVMHPQDGPAKTRIG
jgi:hypothetical protein